MRLERIKFPIPQYLAQYLFIKEGRKEKEEKLEQEPKWKEKKKRKLIKGSKGNFLQRECDFVKREVGFP